MLARDGRAAAAIVTSDHPSAVIAAAAADLQKYLERITGVEFAVRSESAAGSGPLIVVGGGKLASAAGIETAAIEAEGYVIRTSPNRPAFAARSLTATSSTFGLITSQTINPRAGSTRGEAGLVISNRMAMRSLILAAVGLAVLTTSCARKPANIIGVIPKGSSHVFWQTVHAGAIKAARETGYEILWNAPAVEGDRSRQIAIVESMINQEVAGIALAPADREALSAVVERAAAAGIPVMIFDSGIDTPKRLGYVGTDNKNGGRLAARRLGEVLGGKGLAAVITDTPGSASTGERDAGFVDEIAKKLPQIRLLDIRYCETNRAKARAITENLLTAHSDLAGIFADHENATAGTALALKSRNRRDVKLVGFDASEQLTADMKDGWIDSLIVQNPFEMGYDAVHDIALKLKGRTPPAETDTGVTLVRAQDLERAEIKKILFPDIQQYLAGSHQ